MEAEEAEVKKEGYQEEMVAQVVEQLEIQPHRLLQQELHFLHKVIVAERVELSIQGLTGLAVAVEKELQEEMEAVVLVVQQEQEHHTLVQPMLLEALEVLQLEDQLAQVAQLAILEMAEMEQAVLVPIIKDKLAALV